MEKKNGFYPYIEITTTVCDYYNYNYNNCCCCCCHASRKPDQVPLGQLPLQRPTVKLCRRAVGSELDRSLGLLLLRTLMGLRFPRGRLWGSGSHPVSPVSLGNSHPLGPNLLGMAEWEWVLLSWKILTQSNINCVYASSSRVWHDVAFCNTSYYNVT